MSGSVPSRSPKGFPERPAAVKTSVGLGSRVSDEVAEGMAISAEDDVGMGSDSLGGFVYCERKTWRELNTFVSCETWKIHIWPLCSIIADWFWSKGMTLVGPLKFEALEYDIVRTFDILTFGLDSPTSNESRSIESTTVNWRSCGVVVSSQRRMQNGDCRSREIAGSERMSSEKIAMNMSTIDELERNLWRWLNSLEYIERIDGGISPQCRRDNRSLITFEKSEMWVVYYENRHNFPLLQRGHCLRKTRHVC